MRSSSLLLLVTPTHGVFFSWNICRHFSFRRYLKPDLVAFKFDFNFNLDKFLIYRPICTLDINYELIYEKVFNLPFTLLNENHWLFLFNLCTRWVEYIGSNRHNWIPIWIHVRVKFVCSSVFLDPGLRRQIKETSVKVQKTVINKHS